MTREDVIGWIEFLSDDARSKADSLVPTDIEIACRIAIDALKAQEPRLYTLDELKCLPSGEESDMPVCVEFKIPIHRYDKGTLIQWHGARYCKEELLTAKRFYNRGEYNRTWRVWTQIPTKKQRTETPWQEG